MRNVLHPGTWKRLTCALALVAAATFITPAPGNAGPISPGGTGGCASNQQTWIHYYSDPQKLNHTCQDVIKPCPGELRTYMCETSKTPYYNYSCHPCYPN